MPPDQERETLCKSAPGAGLTLSWDLLRRQKRKELPLECAYAAAPRAGEEARLLAAVLARPEHTEHRREDRTT